MTIFLEGVLYMIGFTSMSDAEYRATIDQDIRTASLQLEAFDASNAAAVICVRDATGAMNTLYCGNPMYLMICYSALINRYLRENNIDLDKFMTLDELTEKIAPMAYEENTPEFPIDKNEKLTDPREGQEAVQANTNVFISLDDIRGTFARYCPPEEVWFLSACVDGTTACVTNASCQDTLQPLRFSIGHFLSNVDCPFCGGKMDFQHFMKHVSDIQNRTTDM